MKTWCVVLAMLVLSACVSAALAEGEGKAKTLRGAITKIDGNNVTVGDATFSIEGASIVTANGDKKTGTDLAVGTTIVVKLSADGKSATTVVLAPKASAGGRERAPGESLK